MTTISRNIAPNANATLLRRRRIAASLYGPMPGCGWPGLPSSPPSSPPVNSMLVSAAAMNGSRPELTPRPASQGSLQLQRTEVVQVGRVEDRGVEVDLVREELRLFDLAVHVHVALRGCVLVEGLPPVGDRIQLGRRHLVQILQLALDLGVVDLAEVLVVDRLDRVGVQQQVEV